MKVFNSNNLNHTLKLVPRLYVENITLDIRHELTDTNTTIENITSFKDNGYLRLDFNFEFKDGGSYEIVCRNNNELVWRGKAYATTETDLENYKIL
jgi:hypothetical protein